MAIELNKEVLKKHGASQETSSISFNDGRSFRFFGGAGTVYIYGLAGKTKEHFNVFIEALKEQHHIIAITSEEDGALYELLEAGFEEIFSNGNTASGRELKTMEYVYA